MRESRGVPHPPPYWGFRDIYISDTSRPEAWKQAHGDGGARQSNLSLEDKPRLMLRVATRRPSSTREGHEYRQKGGFSALPEVPLALREAPRERDGRGPEITPGAQRSHPSPLTGSAEGKISSVPNLFEIGGAKLKVD